MDDCVIVARVQRDIVSARLRQRENDIQCLVAIELKTERFAPEHLAQINFYLEALDREVKNENENPSIGILLCKGKDDVVVEYALSRTLNPAMVADYQLALPNKKLLQDKWLEILEMNEKGGADV